MTGAASSAVGDERRFETCGETFWTSFGDSELIFGERGGRALERRSWLAGITTGGNGDGFNARRLGFARILQGQNAQNRRTPHLYFPLTHMKHRPPHLHRWIKI
ncbi:hypothetical protein GQ457_16G026270 [Hibiscus cannabinus]